MSDDAGRGFVTLTDGAARVDLLPALGGRIAQVTLGSRPLLRGPEHAALGWPWWGSYPMLPWANRIPGGVAGSAATRSRAGELADGRRSRPRYERPGTSSPPGRPRRRWRSRSPSTATTCGRSSVRPVADALDLEIDVVNVAEWPVPAGVGIHPWFVAAPVRVPAELVWPGDGPIPDGLPRAVRADEDLRRPVRRRRWTVLHRSRTRSMRPHL